jgi:cytochrome b561
MRFLNTQDRYGAGAMVLHWLMAVLLLALLVLGFYMVALPDVGFDSKKVNLILLHKQLGILALLLVAVRVLWRMSNILPSLVPHLPEWQKVLARFVHLSFYALMFALPVSGWLMSSASGITVSFFGLFPLPDFISHDELRFKQLIEIHKYLGFALIAFMLAHIGAALRHHFIFRDDTLRRMLSVPKEHGPSR